ncbi:MAG: hypothetical protein AB7I98_03775 [Verrucomicrobiales bacterium]
MSGSKIKTTHFGCEGSPLNGRLIPLGWKELSFQGKVWAIVRNGWAADWAKASSIMAAHSAAVRAAKRAREDAKKAKRKGRRKPEADTRSGKDRAAGDVILTREDFLD